MAEPSYLDLLRARYEELAQRPPQTLHLPIVWGVSDTADGHIGMLVEYREQGWLETQEIARKYRSNTSDLAVLDGAREQLAKCCVDVWVRDDEAGQPVDTVPVGKWLPGMGQGKGPVSFMKAAQLLGLPHEDGLEAVAAVLVEDWQVMDHVAKLSAWQPGPPPEVGDEYMGESKAESDSAS